MAWCKSRLKWHSIKDTIRGPVACIWVCSKIGRQETDLPGRNIDQPLVIGWAVRVLLSKYTPICLCPTFVADWLLSSPKLKRLTSSSLQTPAHSFPSASTQLCVCFFKAISNCKDQVSSSICFAMSSCQLGQLSQEPTAAGNFAGACGQPRPVHLEMCREYRWQNSIQILGFTFEGAAVGKNNRVLRRGLLVEQAMLWFVPLFQGNLSLVFQIPYMAIHKFETLHHLSCFGLKILFAAAGIRTHTWRTQRNGQHLLGLRMSSSPSDVVKS